MLIISRRLGETITIETPAGELIRVAVLGVKGKLAESVAFFEDVFINLRKRSRVFLLIFKFELISLPGI